MAKSEGGIQHAVEELNEMFKTPQRKINSAKTSIKV